MFSTKGNQRGEWHFLLLGLGGLVALVLLVSSFSVQSAQAGLPANTVTSGNTSPAQAASAPQNPDCTLTFQGVIDQNDPLQLGRLNNLANASTCAIPRTCPGVLDSTSRHYDAYTFVNANNSTTCVTVGLTPA